MEYILLSIPDRTNAGVIFARLWSSCTNRIVMHMRELSVLCLTFTLLYSFPSVCLSVFFLCLCVLLCHCFCLLFYGPCCLN